MPNASETLWNCKNITMKNVMAKGDYFGMQCENIEIDGFTLTGNYSFNYLCGLQSMKNELRTY